MHNRQLFPVEYMNWSTHWHKHMEKYVFFITGVRTRKDIQTYFFFWYLRLLRYFKKTACVVGCTTSWLKLKSTCLCSAIVSSIHFGAFSRTCSIYLYRTVQNILTQQCTLPTYILPVLRSKKGLRAAMPSQTLLGFVMGTARLWTSVLWSRGLL